MAGTQGFEPRYAAPEAAVLPLDDVPIKPKLHFTRTRHARIQRTPHSKLEVEDEEVVAGERRCLACSPRPAGRSIGKRSSPRATSAISPTSSTPPASPNWKPTAPPWSGPPARRWRWSPFPSLEGEPIEDVANTIYRAWGVGQKGKNEGILLLLAIGDRRNRLEVGYGLEPILPDGFVGLRAARNASGAAPAALRRSPDGRGGDHRRHRRQGQERHPHRSTSAPHPQHPRRFHSLAR